MTKRKLNIKLLTKVRDRIRDIPESYDQGFYVGEALKAPCGTAACVAGETIICSAKSIDVGILRLNQLNADWSTGGPHGVAARRLGLSEDEAETLFTAEPEGDLDNENNGWPEPFRTQWARVKTRKAQARVAVRYLTHIIETGRVLD